MANTYLDYDGLALYDEKIKQVIGGKVDKDGAKVLSTNDYTTEEKTKLAGITAGATKNSASSTTPKMDGTAAVGSETAYAKGDHVHPTDTSRQEKLVSGTNIKTVGGTSLLGSGDLSVVKGITFADPHDTYVVPVSGATAYIDLGDGLSVDDSGNKVTISADIPSAGSTAPKMDGTAAVGTSTSYARADHVHPTDTSRAPLASPTFTGTPKAPTATAGTKDTQIATTEFVGTAITNAIAGVQGISYEVVTTLPTTGKAGVIYLISNSGSGQNVYDEYIWTGGKYERLGTTDVDLSGYQPKMDAITNAQINGLFA